MQCQSGLQRRLWQSEDRLPVDETAHASPFVVPEALFRIEDAVRPQNVRVQAFRPVAAERFFAIRADRLTAAWSYRLRNIRLDQRGATIVQADGNYTNFIRRCTLAAAGIAFIVSSVPVSAEETYPERQFDFWRVYGWDKSCWMSGEYEDGTTFSYSLDMNPVRSYIALRNRKWKSIQAGKSYAIRLEIDGWQTTDAATGVAMGESGVSYFIKGNEQYEFPMKLAQGSLLRAYVNGKMIGSYNLKSSGEAVKELVRCADALKDSDGSDPFEKTI